MTTVVGSDGFPPLYDEEALWKEWSTDEIWIGKLGKGRWVPKVRDHVRNPDTYETWIVDHLDPVSLIPTLRAIRPIWLTTEISEEDVLFGVGPSTLMETSRALLNTTVFPHTMTLDQRWMPKGTLASYVKVFLGTDTSIEGEVISKTYDASGNFVSNNVALEMVALDSHTNYAVKIPKRFNVTTKYENGERVTAVCYADDGHVVERRQFLIEITDTIMDVNQGVKYVEEINLESIWLSPSSADQLEYPLNIPMDALNLFGVVTYSDGSTLRLPVDGTKFSMQGLDSRLSSIEGRPVPLVLTYTLSPGEQAFSSSGVNKNKVVKPYTLVTINRNDSIDAKLFVYPEWISSAVGYRLKWFMLNMSRNVYFDVTEYVTLSDALSPYDPKLYGYVQRMQAIINLRDVSGNFIPFIHTQLVEVVLEQPANNDPEPNWTVTSEYQTQAKRFGGKVWARKVSANLVNFTGGTESFEDWLQSYYWDALPLVSPTESKAPTPTHFSVTVGTTTTEWPIASWNQDLAVSNTVNAMSTAFIRFFKRVPSGDIHLAYAASMIKSY